MDCDHLVEFLDSDERLVRRATEFLVDGFANGCTCIAVLTDTHRQWIDALLNERGTQAQELEAAYRYIFIDAEATLGMLMSGGKLDRAEFHRMMGQLLQLASSGDRSVRIVGELVSLLAQRNQLDAVVELEEAWNELSRLYAFKLYCLYDLAQPLGTAYRNHIRSIHSREVVSGS